MAAAIQRPGWRTGTALMRSGAGSATASLLADGGVDLGGLDRAPRDIPLLQDRRVGTVLDQRLQAVLNGLRKAGSFLDGDAVGERPVVLADDLELASVLDLVGRHRRVGHTDLGPPARDREVGAVLVGERKHLHARLAGLLALLPLCRGVGDLRGALLRRDRVTAEFGQAVDLRSGALLAEE